MTITRGLVAIIKSTGGIFPAVACIESGKRFWTPIGPGTTREWTMPEDARVWLMQLGSDLPDPLGVAKRHHEPFRVEILGATWVSWLSGKLTEKSISAVKTAYNMAEESEAYTPGRQLDIEAQDKLDFAAHVKTATPPWEEQRSMYDDARVFAAARRLYMADLWQPTTLDKETARKYWADLRDALGLEPGGSTDLHASAMEKSMGEAIVEEFIDDAPTRTPGPNLVRYSIGMEAWREYQWIVDDKDGNWRSITYRIERPRAVAYRPGGATHRVQDAEGIVHCVPAPGEKGCVLRWPGEISF